MLKIDEMLYKEKMSYLLSFQCYVKLFLVEPVCFVYLIFYEI